MTCAPGMKDRGWDRDLRRDLVALTDAYAAGLLVSLLDGPEREALQLSHLESMAAAAGLGVAEFPIRDGSVPGSVEALVALVDRILGAAYAGQTVVIHCREGRGRTGLVAACCLAALGREAGEALAATRSVRAGAVETAEQAEFVCRFADWWRRVRRP